MCSLHKVGLACLLVATAGMACALSAPTTGDIVGVWSEVKPGDSSAIGKGECGEIELFADGTFDGRNVPDSLVGGEGFDRIDISGTWLLEVASPAAFSVHRIRLAVKPNETSPDGFLGELGLTVGRGALFSGEDETVVFSKGSERCGWTS